MGSFPNGSWILSGNTGLIVSVGTKEIHLSLHEFGWECCATSIFQIFERCRYRGKVLVGQGALYHDFFQRAESAVQLPRDFIGMLQVCPVMIG